MRLPCPICRSRDIREFAYKGAAVALSRPAPDAGEAAWDEYMHLRDNPAGVTDELWYHRDGCGSWLVVTRNTVTHKVIGARLADPDDILAAAPDTPTTPDPAEEDA